MSEAENGSGPGTLPPTPLFYSVLAAFIAVAFYNVIEINVQVFNIFKKWGGLYFWAILVASWGCVLLSVGNIALKLFTPGVGFGVSGTMILFGWWMVVLGQACVLYSRLHLVIRSQWIMRLVPVMIALIFFGLCLPTSVATYGMMSDKTDYWLPRFNILERVQLVCIELEEMIISGLYIWATVKILRPSFNVRTKRVMWSLIYVNIFVAGLDMIMIVMEFVNYYDLEASLKPMLYSIKLKVEFAVLNQLMAIAKSGLASGGYQDYDTAHPDAFNDKTTAKGLWSTQSESRWTRHLPHRHDHHRSTETNTSDGGLSRADTGPGDSRQHLAASMELPIMTTANPNTHPSTNGLESRSAGGIRPRAREERGGVLPAPRPPAPAKMRSSQSGDSDTLTEHSWLELDSQHPTPGAEDASARVSPPPPPPPPPPPHMATAAEGTRQKDWDPSRRPHEKQSSYDARAQSANRPGLMGGRRRKSVTEFGMGDALDEVADDEVGLSLFRDTLQDSRGPVP
ncbi:MAG: hypothetical protein M1838_003001 [Thelocarpon superellum]|nr:MAG: hypothetical protein M1838_003001 [Thelocarpon superellum]